MIGWLAALVTAAGTAGTIIYERVDRSKHRLPKMLASTGFLAVAVAAGALDVSWGRVLLVGLLLAWVGDLALTYPGRKAFMLGLVSFLLGHVAYVAAFTARGIDAGSILLPTLAAAVMAALVLGWLLPHVGADLRPPVLAYTFIISTMLVLAFGTYGFEPDARISLGAAAFYASDLAVGRDRFVTPGWINRLWGLPLYFGGQLLLAWAAGG